jgi:hypothetical protein
MADRKLLEERLKATVGDPRIRVVALATRCQIVCRETDEELVAEVAARYATEPVQVIGL